MPDEAIAHFKGRLSRDAALKRSKKDTPYAHLSVHVNKAGYFDLTAFDDMAEEVGGWKEGDGVEIEANIGKRKYQDKWQTQFIVNTAKKVKSEDGIPF